MFRYQRGFVSIPHYKNW